MPDEWTGKGSWFRGGTVAREKYAKGIDRIFGRKQMATTEMNEKLDLVQIYLEEIKIEMGEDFHAGDVLRDCLTPNTLTIFIDISAGAYVDCTKPISKSLIYDHILSAHQDMLARIQQSIEKFQQIKGAYDGR